MTGELSGLVVGRPKRSAVERTIPVSRISVGRCGTGLGCDEEGGAKCNMTGETGKG